MGVTNKQRGVTMHAGGDIDAEIGLVSIASQSIALVNTTQVLPWDLNIHDAFRFKHNIAVNNDEITMPITLPTFHFDLELQVDNGAGNNLLTVWAQTNIGGAGWTNIAESGTHVVMPPNTSLILPHSRTLPMPKDGEVKIRFVMQGDNTLLSLEAHAAAGDFPRIPSASLFMSAN